MHFLTRLVGEVNGESRFCTAVHHNAVIFLKTVSLHSTRLETSMHLAEAALIFNREFTFIKFGRIFISFIHHCSIHSRLLR